MLFRSPVLSIDSVVTNNPQFSFTIVDPSVDTNFLRHEFMDGVEITSFDGSPYLATSRHRFLDELPALVDSFEPDVVILMVTVADVADRQWDTAEGTLTPLDPRYVDRMRTSYSAIDELVRDHGGATVVWVVPPVPATYFPTADLGEADRYEVQHRVIRQVAAAAGSALCDLDAWFRRAGAVGDMWWRPDGTHLTDESARRLEIGRAHV